MLEILDEYYLINSLKLFLRIVFVFVCFSSIILLMAPAIFGKMAQILQQKRGMRKEVISRLEVDRSIIDHFLYNHRKIVAAVGIVIPLILFIVLR